MFLNQLKDNQKELFLSLCAHAVMADGVFVFEEMESIALYCHEMMIPNHMPDTELPLDDILDELSRITSRQEKNIIVTELLMLFKSDNDYAEGEKAMMNKVLAKFEFETEKYNALEQLVDEYIAASQALEVAVNN